MTYDEILSLISPTPEERYRIEKSRELLLEAIEERFQGNKNYSHTTVIGSAATGNFLRGYRDIDALILLNYYNAESFRRTIKNIGGLEQIDFRGRKMTVEDKVDARYNHFDVSIGAVLLSGSPESSLGLDMEQHPTFTITKLGESKRSDILLSKQFFKNIGLYGEKLGGFTIEQMVLFYGSFDKLIRAIKNGDRIYIDFSGKYRGERTPIVISYPFCGLDNLAKKVDERDLFISREYASKVLSDPEQFLEDTRRVMNKDFWLKRAVKYKDSEEFGFPDIHLNHRENRIMRKKVNPYSHKKVLDVGCANGYSTIAISRPGDNFIWGIDASIEAIEMANRLKKEKGFKDLTFQVGQMTEIPFDSEYFDIVYAKRSLSNLPSIREQKKAIKEISRVTKMGGHVYIFDLVMEGYQRLNRLRNIFGLDEIELPFHCIPIKEDFIKTAVDNGLRFEREEDLTSTYYFMSRVLYPSLLKPFRKQARSNSLPNQLFSMLPSFRNIGVSKLYTLLKK